MGSMFQGTVNRLLDILRVLPEEATPRRHHEYLDMQSNGKYAQRLIFVVILLINVFKINLSLFSPIMKWYSTRKCDDVPAVLVDG